MSDIYHLRSFSMKNMLICLSVLPFLSACQVGLSVGANTQQISPDVVNAIAESVNTPSTSEQTGALIPKDKPLVIETTGNAYFSVSTPEKNMLYAQRLELMTNQMGQLITVEGYQLEPNTLIPPGSTSIHVLDNGTIEVVHGSEEMELGQIPRISFENASQLTSQGAFLEANENSGEPVTTLSFDDTIRVVSEKYTF